MIFRALSDREVASTLRPRSPTPVRESASTLRKLTNTADRSGIGVTLHGLRFDRFGNLIDQLSNAVFPAAYVWRLPAVTGLSFVDQNGARIDGATADVYVDQHPETYRES